ncbi:MAG: 4Fe-4S dicluster domain-containing protein [Candidatus Lokiarchaeota archaeon]|nr:4Fe-4S dicluster domain-containing protein [Candidatus Lokiarchaeota archaeon]MBD3198939.1 4Fe-4S dicluster domain-containing protein [Candidatus Lokiarchaeota archaeon]
MSFPKITRSISKEEERVKIKFLTEDFELILNREKCTGCGTCSRVCPKEAVSRGPVGASRRFPTTQDIIPEVYNPKKCVFCGTCVLMCPFGALTLKKNGEDIPLKELTIVAEHAVPTLDIEFKEIENNEGKKRTVRSYAEAKVSIIDEECAGGCESCAIVCPAGAITTPEKSDKGWESVPNVVVDEEKCIACGACDNACPTGAIQLEITDVKYSGDYNEIFWDPLIERLKALRWSNQEVGGAE